MGYNKTNAIMSLLVFYNFAQQNRKESNCYKLCILYNLVYSIQHTHVVFQGNTRLILATSGYKTAVSSCLSIAVSATVTGAEELRRARSL